MKLNGNSSAKGKGFKKGKSGNPGGRPKGIAALVRAQTDDGADIVDMMVGILHGTLLVDGKHPQHQHVIAAAQWLTDRAFGKVKDTVEVQEPDGGSTSMAAIIAAARQLAKERWQEESQAAVSPRPPSSG